jgi:hypothetical protein
VRAVFVSFVVSAFAQPISPLRVAGVVLLAGGVALVRLS